MEPTSNGGGGLAKKLAAVMGVANRIPKRGRNDFHKYDYATEADIAEAIRKELAERHVILLPEILDQTRVPVGEKGSVLTTITMNFTFIDGETGESVTRRWAGAGTDKEDKGLYKAMTGGEKYFLLKTFLMPTGDDPEADDKKPAQATTQAQQTAALAEPKGYVNWLADLTAVADEGSAALKATWVKSRPEYRQYLTKTAPEAWERLKTTAAQREQVPA